MQFFIEFLNSPQIILKFFKKHVEPKRKEEVFALYDYAALDDNQLSFKAGDEFVLSDCRDPTWWLVKSKANKKYGFVPSDYMARMAEKANIEWCSLTMNREEAEKILADDRYHTGAFIIRPRSDDRNETSITDITDRNVGYRNVYDALALTLKVALDDGSTEIHSYGIERDQNGFRIQDGHLSFEDMESFINHYAGAISGISQRLMFSVKKNMMLPIVNDPRFWEIDRRYLITGRVVGEGNFGEVKEARLNSRITVAVKSITNDVMTADQFLQEASIMKTFDHPNIVRLHGVCNDPIYIIIEFMRNGPLLDCLRNGKVQPEEYKYIATKIVDGMVYLEEMNLVHRDLAARNVLVGETTKIIKISDFGMAIALADNDVYRTFSQLFPVKWTAPEAFIFGGAETYQRRGTFTVKSDVWSYGVVLFEVYSGGKEPYDGHSNSEIFRMITGQGSRMRCPTECPHQLYDEVMRPCWRHEPDDRPSFKKLKEKLDEINDE